MDPRYQTAARAVEVLELDANPATAPTVAAEPGFGLLAALFDTAHAREHIASTTALADFLAEPDLTEGLRLWFGGSALRNRAQIKLLVSRWLNRDLARIDQLLNDQVNVILHHPALQQLEASYRNLYWLVHQAPEEANIKIRVLTASWRDVSRDMERATDFDQSHLFRKIYSDEFGTPGGEPFSVMLGDYEIHHKPSADHPYDDLNTLQMLSGIAASAFCPFLAAAHPSFLGLDSFTDLDRPTDMTRQFAQTEYLKWHALRATDDARFVGLVAPRILTRVPYTESDRRRDGFRFSEDTADPNRRGYLWGNAAYALGSVLIKAFADHGWLANIRGVNKESTGGGVVEGLPTHYFSTDAYGVASKGSTDGVITDMQEKEYVELGLIPFSPIPDSEMSAFFDVPSVQKPKVYDEEVATANSRMSAMLQYVLCVSRFAHYLKVMFRDRVGSFATPEAVARDLNQWLRNYTATNDTNEDTRAKFPLREGRAEVREHPSKPGTYLCTVWLRPQYQLDQISSAMKLQTDMEPRGQG